MLKRIGRRRSVAMAIGLSTVMLVAGLAIGFVAGGAGRSAHAMGMNGGLVIEPDGSVVACTPILGCSNQPAGTCQLDGQSQTVACHFSLDRHAGGALQQDNAACYLHQATGPEGGGYFITTNTHIVYAPSGEVTARCVYDFPVQL
ncbi:MAG TPA: hypothetical protein VFY89_00885 [Ktedonobacterales bacterium]